ncbi:metal ABC transporter ATP-binding protein [Actinomyces minihominis]|uniref:metal ABC transporter ATP-binding protein n=1 Tax=Actinomyces minihominis TaxID=2002838 RepID=UPI000C085546|nr:metal ABC transporter ATP-binding protein [Actinomyces minihominis]
MESATAKPAIVLRDTRAGYRGHVVLHDLNLQIDEGECVAITGNNGSGKSTLLKTLIDTIPLQGGEVDVLGFTRRATQAPVGTAPWYSVGYVPQRLASAGGIESTVQEMVQSGLLGTGHLRLPRNWAERVKNALDLVGMYHRLHEPFQNLSGGQQQRVLIARALVRNPSLILMDEPLTGLDEHNRLRLREILEASLLRGATVVVVLHELGELRPLITREIRVSAGHITHDGPCTHDTHQDLAAPWWDHDQLHGHDATDDEFEHA